MPTYLKRVLWRLTNKLIKRTFDTMCYTYAQKKWEKNAGITSNWNDIIYNPQCTQSKCSYFIKIVGT